MSNGKRQITDYYWERLLERYRYYDGHSIEWLRTTAHQLALANSLGATLSAGLAGVLHAPHLLIPSFIFFVGTMLIVAASVLAHFGNSKYADEIRERIDRLADKIKTGHEEAPQFAKNLLHTDAKTGAVLHTVGTVLAWSSLVAIAAGFVSMATALVCVIP